MKIPAYYETLASPLGSLLLVATDEGLLRVAFEADQDQSISTLEEAFELKRSHDKMSRAVSEVTEYLSGFRTTFDLKFDRQLSKGYRSVVQDILLGIPYATTMSYQEVARLSSSPNAVRAVGTACATNPLPLVIPCHRVLRGDGTLGGYAGGLEAKEFLLELERKNPPPLLPH